MKNISPAELIPLDIFEGQEPIKIDLVYAKPDHPRNMFKEAIYHDKARLWAHKDLAAITILTARILNKKFGWILEIKDCLRTYDAQVAMAETQIVRDNPQWMMDPPLLSAPGTGAHPRAMAVDVHPIDKDGNHIDMGTPFDDMRDESSRDFKDFSDQILQNRHELESAFVQSAKALNLPLLPLPNEWWDFRLPNDYTQQFAPLHDADLPPQMQMTAKIENNIPDFNDAHFEKLADSILAMIEPHNGNL